MSKIDLNFVSRYTKQSYDGSTSATKVRATNRKFIYSRYRPSNEFRADDDEFFLSCAFTPDDQCLLVGSDNGNVFIFNKYNETLIAQKSVHEYDVTSLVPHKSGELLLTSGRSRTDHNSALWNIKDNFENQFKFHGCCDAKFTHANDKVLGTTETMARLYDLNSGQVIHEYKTEISNLPECNKAALNLSDELLLTNGVMFDVRSGKEVHRFDKMNLYMYSAFHTYRFEIICSSEIWDLRTFDLLQTVENLEFCNVKFNNYGDVIFGLPAYSSNRENIKVVDATNYSSITGKGVNRIVTSLAISNTDTQIATTTIDLDVDVDVCLYDIGMTPGWH